MSKAKLKKELEGMTRQQLIEIILNAYSARKATKEYFEFFLNPDVDAKLDEMRQKVLKEVTRSKRGHQSKFRVSVIKNIIKDFESLDPGPAYVLKLMLFSFNVVMAYSLMFYYTDTQDKAAISLAAAALKYADTHCLFDKTLAGINKILDNSEGSEKYLRDKVRSALTFGSEKIY